MLINKSDSLEYFSNLYQDAHSISALSIEINALVWIQGGWVIIVSTVNELESLGISVKKMNELNDDYELENLIENIKQTWIQDYKTCYNDK